MVLCNLLLLGTLALGQSQLSPEKIQNLEAGWQKSLSNIAASQQATLFVDVNLSAPPPDALPASIGAVGMEILARRIGRVRTEIQGIQAFGRHTDSQWAPGSVRGLMLDWLSEADTSRFVGKNAPGMSTDELPETTRNEILAQAALFPALYPQVTAGNPITVKVRVEVGVEYKDPRSGQLVRFNLPQPVSTDQHSIRRSEKSEASKPLAKPVTGPLDFGTGEVVSLDELMTKAGEAFGVAYRWDTRLRESRYFLNGSYTREAFEACVAKIVDPPPIRPHTSAKEAQERLLYSLAAGKLEPLLRQSQVSEDLLQKVLKGGSVTASDLSWQSSYAQERMRKSGLGEEASVRVYPAIVVMLDAGGRTRTGPKTEDANAIEIIIRP